MNEHICLWKSLHDPNPSSKATFKRGQLGSWLRKWINGFKFWHRICVCATGKRWCVFLPLSFSSSHSCHIFKKIALVISSADGVLLSMALTRLLFCYLTIHWLIHSSFHLCGSLPLNSWAVIQRCLILIFLFTRVLARLVLLSMPAFFLDVNRLWAIYLSVKYRWLIHSKTDGSIWSFFSELTFVPSALGIYVPSILLSYLHILPFISPSDGHTDQFLTSCSENYYTCPL